MVLFNYAVTGNPSRNSKKQFESSKNGNLQPLGEIVYKMCQKS